jgi:hydroxymethylglutaryl-CoA synthase
MKRIGIEKLNVYGTSLYLDQKKLAEARGREPEKVLTDFLIETRSLNPPWEDTVTMGANAAKPLLEGMDLNEIGLLIVGTEGSVDFGKPISTNIHSALGLPSNVRNFETKFACYSGAAGVDAAVNWIASGLNRGKKALVIASDFSRMHLHRPEEFVLGGLGAAMIISEDPKIVEFELEKKGTWTTDAYDTFRPSARHEVGNNEVSLFTYMDALEGAYSEYKKNVGAEVDFDRDFSNFVYHTPFAGIAFQAHRTLCNLSAPRKKAEVREDFERRVMPALRLARRLGSSYGASNYSGLAGVVLGAPELSAGDRIGFFAYGSGAIGEFYSGIVLPEAKDSVRAMGIDDQLDKRREVSVEEYEKLEKYRERHIESADFVPDFSMLDDWYESFYEGKGYLVLKQVKDFYRTYEWS